MSPADWDNIYRVYKKGFYTTNAAFSVAAPIGMMNIDYLDAAHYYNGDGRTFDRNGQQDAYLLEFED